MSILADLCLKFQTHPENLATEALGILLNESALGDAFTRLIAGETAQVLEAPVEFRTQATGDEDERPDLVGFTPDGAGRLVVEAKFWATLTPNQPVGYLKRLQHLVPGWLVFVAPEARHEILWNEILSRMKTEGLSISSVGAAKPELRSMNVGSSVVVLVSWRLVISTLAAAARAVAHLRTLDIDQLGALASRMETDAFLPLREHELSPSHGRRFYQFTEIVDDAIARAETLGVCKKAGNKTGGAGYYGTSILIGGYKFFFCVSAWSWGFYAGTPFWLTFSEFEPGEWPEVLSRLAPLAAEAPPRLLRDRRYRNLPIIPLRPPVGAEKDAVVDELVRQLQDVARYMSPPK
jgi:hypothetical protein